MCIENELSKVKEKINEIEEKSADGGYIFRGEPEPFKEKYEGKVSSNLWREYRIEADHFDIEVVQMEMLEAAKKHTRDPPRQFLADLAASLNVTGEYIGETTDFEILTEIQHYGGKTNLIDFATDYLRALFFACDGSHDKDGRIILLQRTEDKNNKYQIEEPKNPRNRVISQKSIFVRPPKGYVETSDYDVINIPKSLKQSMLNHLRKYHNISTETIYNDLHGFIRNQDLHGDAYTQFYRGFTFQNREDEATTSEEKQKERDKSIEYYSKAIELKPDFPEAYTNRGNTYSKNGRNDLAIRDYNKAIQLNPNYSNAYNSRGIIHYLKSEVNHAIEDFTKAIQLDPNNAEIYSNRGAAYEKMNKVDLAIKDYNKAIELKPDSINAYNNRALTFGSTGDYESSIEDFTKVIQLNPDNAEAYCNQGAVYVKVGDYERAFKNFTKAIQLNPNYAEAYNNRGTTYMDKGNYNFAIKDYNIAIQLQPDYISAFYNRGAAYHNKGEYDLAIKDYSKVIKTDHRDANAYYNRGMAYNRKDEVDLAIKDYDKAIELKPDFAEVYNNRGYIYHKKGKYARAVKDYDLALKLKWNPTLVYNNRIMALLHLQEWEKAKSDLIIVRNRGVDIIALFHKVYSSIDDFDQKHGVKLSADIAAMLTPP